MGSRVARKAMRHAVHSSTWLVTPDKFLSPEQVAKLRVSIETARQAALGADDELAVRNAVLVELLLGSGLRVSELCGLRVGDVYLRNGRADVLVRRGKGGKSRMIAISERLALYLRTYLAWRERGGETLDRERPFFRSERGRSLTRSAVHRIWKLALLRAGLPTSWGVHATRHSFAVEVYRKTRDIRLTQRLLGHANVATTVTYASLLDEDIRRGVERVWA
jgi:site-specific recombinase XerD